MTLTPPSRREIVAITVALVALVVAAVAVASARDDRHPPAALPSLSPTPAAPTVTTTPTPTPTPTRTPSPTPTPSPSPTPAPVPYHRGVRPTPPPDQVPAITVTAAAVKATVRTVEVATLVIDVRSRYIATVLVAWDDGSTDQLSTDGSCVEPATPESHRIKAAHRYRFPGVYYAVLRVTYGCGAKAGDNVRVVRLRVTPGPNLGNGPARPEASVLGDWDQNASDGWLRFSLAASDADGWVTKVVIDWGDGTRTTATFGRVGCRAGPWRWPESRQGSQLAHHYPKNGSYHAMLLVTSVGCAGEDTQQATVRYTQRIPIPPPPSL